MCSRVGQPQQAKPEQRGLDKLKPSKTLMKLGAHVPYRKSLAGGAWKWPVEGFGMKGLRAWEDGGLPTLSFTVAIKGLRLLTYHLSDL